jgi:hypothetical protein
MKKILLLAGAFALTLTAMSQSKLDSTIKVNTEKHDFGKVKQGTPVSYYFEVTNITDKPVVVESANATCGCTTPEVPTEHIMSGGLGKIKVVYNAAAVGPFTKDVYIKFAGIDQPKTVHIVGEVLSTEAWDLYVKETEKEKTDKAGKPKQKSNN